MSFRWTRCSSLILCILLAGCTSGRSSYRRIAVVPFENLSSDPSLDWMARAFAEICLYDLTGTPDTDPLGVRTRREIASTTASQSLEGYFSIEGGRLRVETVLRDTARSRTLKTASAAGSPDGIIGLATAIARQVEPRARPYATGNVTAVRALVAGLDATDPAQAAAAFERAAAASPDFSSAYLAWLQLLANRGDRDGARRVLEAARARAARMPELDRARLDLMAAALSGDRASQRRALAVLARLIPADADVFRRLGDLDLAARVYPSAVQWYAGAAGRDPANPLLWNQLGYAQAYARDLESALRSFNRYRELRPDEANPLDSLGDAYYYFGRFDDAGKFYLDAHGKNASFLGGGDLYKAAWARLMAGDLKNADATFSRFLAVRQAAHDPLAPYRQAQWEYLSGRRKQALARLEPLAASAQPALAAVASAQLSLWSLELGNSGRARQLAMQVPAAGTLGALLRFLTEPAAPASEWAVRAERAFPEAAQAGLKQYAVAYALLFAKDFGEARLRFEQLYRETSPSAPDPVDVLLAWTLIQTGQQRSRAADLLAFNAPPDPVGEHPFLSLSFPRVLYLRGLIGAGDRKANYTLFLRYSGELPAIWGEEQRARAAL